MTMTPWRERLGMLDAGEPWFAPWRDVGTQVARTLVRGAPLHEALNVHASGGVQFVPMHELPTGAAYEQYVFDTGRCPTREGLHDFFNGLAWLQLPLAKRQLNRVQAAQIEARGVGSVRGPVRDAATLFDENGAILDAPEPLWQALKARDWLKLFVELRPMWQQARVLVFGHALLEKLVQPRKGLTAHVWAVSCPARSKADVDSWLAAQLTAGCLANKPFVPLPVLGIPGWWPDNRELSFYDDRRVFRPPVSLQA